MSLVTIERSPSLSNIPEDCDNTDGIADIPNFKNTNEDYFASQGTAVLQNSNGRRRSSVILESDSLQYDLKKIVALLHKDESLKLMTNLEKVNSKSDGKRYFCLISRHGNLADENLILGIDIHIGQTTIGFVLPIYRDVSVKLDGDGGFKIIHKDGEKLFKPTTVHALWSTVQLLNKACKIAHKNNYYSGGLNHTWVSYYQDLIRSSRAEIAEWNRMLDADTVVNSNLAPNSAIGEYVIGTEMNERQQNEQKIREQLEEIMREEDIDNVTVIYLREKLQEKLSFSLIDYKRFITEEILIIYGKMDGASQILPQLYLGSTYNASNLKELLRNKITHILNVTRESENFFRDEFEYKNVQVFDKEETELLNYFDECHKFINEAKKRNGSCLVHCQRGISRSASVVISYIMKEMNMTFEDAYAFVKHRRECVKPNDGFQQQLRTYEGILQASANRHSSKFLNAKRSTIRSLPSELYHTCKDVIVDSPTDSCPVDYKRSSVTEVCGSQSTITEASDTVVVEDLDQMADDEVMISNDLASHYDERHIMGVNESNRAAINENSMNSKINPNRSAVINYSLNTPDFFKTCQPVDPQCLLCDSENNETFQTNINANVFPERNNSNSSIKKKAIKIKSDHSWIRSSPDCNDNDDTHEGNKDLSESLSNIKDVSEEILQSFTGTGSEGIDLKFGEKTA